MVLYIIDILTAFSFYLRLLIVKIYYISFKLFAIKQDLGGQGGFLKTALATLSLTILSAAPPQMKIFID